MSNNNKKDVFLISTSLIAVLAIVAPRPGSLFFSHSRMTFLLSALIDQLA